MSAETVDSLLTRTRTIPIDARTGLIGGIEIVQAPEIVDLNHGILPSDQRASLWDSWAQKYHTLLNLTITRELWEGFTEIVAGEIPDSEREIDCLDAGCGTGFVVEALATNFPNARIVGADLSYPFLERAQQGIGTRMRGALGRIALCRTDLTRPYPFEDRSFDLVTMNFVLQYFSPGEQQHIVSESARVLREGGKLVVSTFSEGTKFKDVILPIFVPEILRHGFKAVATLVNIPVAKKFDQMREEGLMNNPSTDALRGFHAQAGFSDFRVAREMMHPVRKGWSYGLYTVGTK